MTEKKKLPLGVLSVLLGLSVACQEPLYDVRAGDMGFQGINLSAAETKRGARTSVLKVPGFHQRSAAASRWLMCVYTDLAIRRGFKYWTVVYPDPPGEDLLIGFPASQDENCAETLGGEFSDGSRLPTMPVERMSVICAMMQGHS